MQNTEENLKNIQIQIEQFEKKYQRLEHSVQLMAVSKKKPLEQIEKAYHFGQRIFGESYVQEALKKIESLKHLDAIEWHFIGPIQSNKTRDIAVHFDWVHSVDRIKIIKRLNEQRSESQLPLNICLQVNIDGEDSKSGFAADNIMEVVQHVLKLKHIKLRGLMAIPKATMDINEQKLAFSRVQQLYKEFQSLSDEVDTLSIGMSGDMEAAIAEGSTMVRVGTAIFGQRIT